jgi:hypothetical protein
MTEYLTEKNIGLIQDSIKAIIQEYKSKEILIKGRLLFKH